MENALMSRTRIHLPCRLRFVESEERYSVYTDADGEEVYLAHGTGQVMVAFDDLDLEKLWSEFVATEHDHYMWGAYVARSTFRDIVRSLTIEPEGIDDWDWCTDCYRPEHQDNLCSTHADLQVCESCFEDYYTCDACDDRYRHTTTTLSGSEVCEGCRNANYTYCDDCNGYYHDTLSANHDHDDSCQCEAPAQQFTVRNDGDPPLPNDTRVTVTLPAGEISGEGLDDIRRLLINHAWGIVDDDEDTAGKLRGVSRRLSELGNQWQTRDGNFTKRLSRFAYKEFALKVTPDLMSRIGCIARDHSTAVDFAIEVTRNLNLSAEEFAHEDSCWWSRNGDYSISRCALKNNGGFGLRTFTDNPDYDDVRGRAWVMPMKRTESGELTPTFETQEPDAFVVFNGYGDLSGYVAARIVSHMAGMTYRKIAFSCRPMYVNSDSGYLIAPEEIAAPYTDGQLSLSVAAHANLHDEEQAMGERVLINA